MANDEKNSQLFKFALPFTNDIYKRDRQEYKYTFVGVNNVSKIEADE
jgi:hypothetical protein